MTIPAVAQLAREGLDLATGVTFLVGENGSGKSTIVEAVAMAFGLSPEGGSDGSSMHATRPTRVAAGQGPPAPARPRGVRWGFFLRAETMHGWYTYIERAPQPRATPTRASTR